MSTTQIPVVYVAGSGHTGSTLLALLLDSHPEICCIGESAIKPAILQRGDAREQLCSCGHPVATCPFWTSVFHGVQALGIPMGADIWSNEYRFSNPLLQRLLSRACRSTSGRRAVLWAADRLPVYSRRVRLTDAANIALARSVLQTSGTRVFADTSKGLPRLIHLLRLPQLDVRVVLLSRDVRGYAASAKRRGLPAVDSARTWLRNQRAMAEVTAALDPARVHSLKYEDMCGDAENTLRRLWRFCGVADVQPPSSVDATEHHVLGNSMRFGGRISVRLDESWRKRLDAKEHDRILEIAGKVNGALGYR